MHVDRIARAAFVGWCALSCTVEKQTGMKTRCVCFGEDQRIAVVADEAAAGGRGNIYLGKQQVFISCLKITKISLAVVRFWKR
jgi:hypothetical protein